MNLRIQRRYTWPILALFVVVLAIAVAGSSRLGINPNNRAFFGPEDPQFSALLAFESEFGSNTNLLFGVSSQVAVTNDAQLVEAVRWLSEHAWDIDGVTRVDSLASYPHGEYSEDSISLSTLFDAHCLDVCSEASSTALFKPHLVNRFISSDGMTLSVIASLELDSEDSAAVSTANQAARALINSASSKYPGLEFHVTGAVPMMQAFMDASDKDLSSLILVAVVVFVALLWVFLRGFVLTAVLVALGISSIVITLGIAGWAGHIVNTATATTPLVIFTLVVASSMHIFLYIAREPCQNKSEVASAVDRAYAANTRPLLLAAVTSVVGLLSLLFVSAPPIRELGILSSVGVIVGVTLLLTVVPCVLVSLKRIEPSWVLVRVQRFLNEMARRIEVGADRPWLYALLFGVCVAMVVFLKVDEDFVRYFGEANTFRQDSETITERLAGPYHAEIMVDSGRPGGIYDPAVVEDVGRLAEFLRADSSVANVLSVTDVLAEVSESLSGVSSLVNVDENALAQYFLSFELALAKGQSTTDFVDVNHRLVRLSVLFGDVSMAEIRAFESRVSRWAADGLPEDVKLVVTGEGIPTAHLSSNSIQQLSVGIAISLLFSSCLVGLIYRSSRIVGVMALATIVPVLAGFGVWAVLFGEIGMAATLVVAVTIGVVIDDSIHLLYRYRDGESELDLSPAEAAGYSVHRTAAAILTTSVVMAGGFTILMLSEFRMNSAFGACSALVIVLALVYNTTLMPRALMWASNK